MNAIGRMTRVTLMLLVLAQRSHASEVAKVSWHSDVQSAWTATQEQGRPLLVFVTRDKCYYCTQMKDRTYADATVAGAINQSFVPLVLDGAIGSRLLAELKVTAFPSTFVISPQAVILDRIDGYVAPEVMAGRLNALRPQFPVAKVSKE